MRFGKKSLLVCNPPPLLRYFVIKIVDDNGRSAFIGIGFSDRSDSFDLNVALQDHFKGVTKEKEIAKVTFDNSFNLISMLIIYRKM